MPQYEISDITTALRAANIAYRVEHPGTMNATVIITAPDGRVMAVAPGSDEHGNITGDGVDVAWHRGDIDTDVTTSDWVETVDELIAAITRP